MNKVKSKNNEQWIKFGSKLGSFLARCNAVCECINKYMKEISGIPTLFDNYKYINHTHYSFSSKYPLELENFYNNIQKRGGIKNYISLRKKEYKKCLFGIKKIFLRTKSDLDNNNLYKLFLKAYDIYAWANSFLGLGTLYTDCLCRKLYEKYGDNYFHFDFGGKTKITKYREELSILSKIKNKKNLDNKIKTILRKYYWMGSLFLIGRDLDETQIMVDAKNIGKKNKIKKKKEKQKLPRNPFIAEMNILTKDRNEELEEFMILEYYFRQILYKIAERTKISFKDLTYLSPKEIGFCLKSKPVPKNKINKRRKLFGFLIKNGRLSSYDGNAAKFLIEKDHKGNNEIRGTVAFSSNKKIKGVVKTVLNSTEIRKVKKGDILVTIMTTPNYIQAIYNAAAIITDEGGITCHAAIISRELNTPCIIGTKIATRVLKDGDLVEVDTIKGTVRKIR